MKLLLKLLCLVILLAACKKDNNNALPPDNEDYTTDSSYRTPLSKGINLSNWFNDYSDVSQYSNRFTNAHFALLKELGFTYVRIPVGQYVLFDHEKPSHLNPVNLQYVDAAVQNAINHGLAVTLNYHTASDDFEETLPLNIVNQDKLAEYWKAVATYFKKYGKTEIFFEVYNEPHVASNGSMSISKTWWNAVQEKLIKNIRSVDQDHFIIAGGETWNSIDGLKLLTPYKVNNIVYNFHFYDPFPFTHQGATWAGDLMTKLRDIPYPSSPALVKPITDTATDNEVKEAVSWYGQEEWNKDKIAASVQRAVDWSTANKNAAIICNEFGSYKPFAPRQSRLDFISDIRSVFEEKNIGWAMWEMDEGFGFINYTGNDRNNFTTDDELLHSLGLR
jgi:aryl-phospho-beta-D-glucosidase BglC (GH1 family)